jgi:lipopolysaccharide/colanic/teichoic acid biosynthesis glycosyltransferase
MHLVVVRKSTNSSESGSDSLLRLAFSCGPLTDVVIGGMSVCDLRKTDVIIAMPEEWEKAGSIDNHQVLFYDGKVSVPQAYLSRRGKSWFVISDGKFFTKIDSKLLYETIATIDSDVIAVDIEPRLSAGHEKILTDPKQNLIGFRLLYTDAVQASPIPSDWPHHLIIRSDIISRLFGDGMLPATFADFLNTCHSVSATVTGMRIGGVVLDLGTEPGQLSLLSGGLGKTAAWRSDSSMTSKSIHKNSIDVSADTRLFGNIVFGRSISVGKNAIIAGPSVIGDGARIADGAVIRECIIGPDVAVPAGCVLQNRVITHSSQLSEQSCDDITGTIGCFKRLVAITGRSRYKTWSRFSYAGCVKRIADIIMASVVLFVFAPVLPFVAMAVKLSSRGPVFFKGIRQGLHGRPFACIKFRTMLVGAEKMQEKLRVLNEADGPQFVISDDPRMSKVGRFLRETYIDEIPQFLSVLLGHMSVIGPRPSPESENVLCPFWRDARLSVKPGVSGLWQICRTRQSMKDFQEWIHYDVEYVRNLSIGLDLWICLQTAKKMFLNFVRQF